MLDRMRQDEFSQVFDIMKASFPPEEMRPYVEEENLLNIDQYEIYVIRDEDQESVKAFISIWEFPSFIYVEHFAVSPDFRNQGLGGEIIDRLCEDTDKDVILEVEPAGEEMANRRIAFYERHGFQLNDYPYFQPKLTDDHDELPLQLMSQPAPLSEDQFDDIRQVLYELVYGYEQAD